MGSLQSVYSWSDDFVEWLGNAANITFCILVVPVSVVVDVFGMRKSVLITIAALNLNAGLRLLPITGIDYESASLVSMFFNGVAGRSGRCRSSSTTTPPRGLLLEALYVCIPYSSTSYVM